MIAGHHIQYVCSHGNLESLFCVYCVSNWEDTYAIFWYRNYYVKICRATTGHVVGKCNLALVGFMNFVTNCFLYGLMAGALKTVDVGIYEEVEVYGGLWVGFYVGVCE